MVALTGIGRSSPEFKFEALHEAPRLTFAQADTGEPLNTRHSLLGVSNGTCVKRVPDTGGGKDLTNWWVYSIGLRALVADAGDEEFNLGFFRVRGIVDDFVEILDLLLGEIDFNHCLSQVW